MVEAELLITPDLDRQALNKMVRQLDSAMKRAARNAGHHFEREIRNGVSRGMRAGTISFAATGKMRGGQGGQVGAVGDSRGTGGSLSAIDLATLASIRQGRNQQKLESKSALIKARQDLAAMRSSDDPVQMARISSQKALIAEQELGIARSAKSSRAMMGGIGVGLGVGALVGAIASAAQMGIEHARNQLATAQGAIETRFNESRAETLLLTGRGLGFEEGMTGKMSRIMAAAGIDRDDQVSILKDLGIAMRDTMLDPKAKPVLREFVDIKDPTQRHAAILASLANATEANAIYALEEMGLGEEGPQLQAALAAERKRLGRDLTAADITALTERDKELGKALQTEAQRVRLFREKQEKWLATANDNFFSKVDGEMMNTYFQSKQKEEDELMDALNNMGKNLTIVTAVDTVTHGLLGEIRDATAFVARFLSSLATHGSTTFNPMDNLMVQMDTDANGNLTGGFKMVPLKSVTAMSTNGIPNPSSAPKGVPMMNTGYPAWTPEKAAAGGK